MVTYLIKSTLCLTLLLAFYHLVLEREKMHRFNRYYLLSSVLISFLAPLYTIYIKVIQEPIIELTQLSDNKVFTEEIIPIEEPINYWNYLLYFSIGVSTILLIRFIKNLYSIYRKVRISEKFEYKNSTIVLVADNILPHTFWNYIFINKKEYETQKIEQELFTHELTHVAQKHTFDVLLIELLKVVFWFNPIFYLLKKSVQLNHEFLADTNVVSQHKNVSKYQHLLINTSAWGNEYALASNLHYLVTKKRIVMMTKQTSKAVIRLKKLAVLPLLIGAIFLFAERVEAQEEIIERVEDQQNLQENKKILTTKLSDGEVIEVWEDAKTPILKIDFENNKYFLNNKSIQLKNLKTVFLKETNGKLSDLEIDVKGKINLSLIKKIQKDLSKEYLNKILLRNNESYIYDDSKKEYIDVPIKRKSSKQSISSEPALKDINLKLKDVNALKLSIKKDTIKKPISIKMSKLSASKKEIKEYKSILAKGKKERLFKHKDILKMQYLYGLMSKEQKNTVDNYASVIPPPPPIPDNATPEQRKKMQAVINKFEKTHKRKVYVAKDNGTKTTYNIISNDTEYNGSSIQVSPKVKKGEKSNIPPPPPPIKKSGSFTKDGVEKGWLQTNKETLYFTKKNGEVVFYNRFGKKVEEPNVKDIQKISIESKNNNTEDGKNITYYLNGKVISKKKMAEIHQDDIKTINVIKEKDGSGAIYITNKK